MNIFSAGFTASYLGWEAERSQQNN